MKRLFFASALIALLLPSMVLTAAAPGGDTLVSVGSPSTPASPIQRVASHRN
jgi:hypothetical protein